MKEKKKKSWLVTVQVNMCANHEIIVPVVATKSSIACMNAEEALKNKGYFHARATHFEEVSE